MKNNTSLNKGIPTNIVQVLTADEIIGISYDREKTQEIIDEISKKIGAEINNYFNRENDYYWLDTAFDIYTNPETLDLEIKQSSYTIFYSLFIYLKNKREVITDYEDIAKFEEKLNLLKSIKTEKQLEKNFPNIYDAYETILNGIDNFKKRINFLSPLEQQLSLNSKQFKVYNKMGNLEEFINEMSFYFSELYNNIDELTKIINEMPKEKCNKLLRNCDVFYLEHGLVYHNLINASKSNDTAEIQKLLYYPNLFFIENQNKLNDDRNMCGNPNYYISVKRSYDLFKELLKKYPELYFGDLTKDDFKGMTLDEVEEFMYEFNKNLHGNWTFFKDENKFKEKITDIIDNDTKEINDKTTRHTKKKELEELLLQKKRFFDSTDPFQKLEGQNAFEGYIAYVYKNGYVVMERYFEGKKIADENAIYVMGLNDFYTITNLTKTEVIGKKICKRFYHKGNWQTRVTEVINKSKQLDPTVKIKELIQDKKIKEVK